MLARLLKALIQNGAAMLKPTVSTPPSAGPTARLMLTPTLLTTTAAGSSCRGTSCGTIDCQAGPTSAALPRRGT